MAIAGVMAALAVPRMSAAADNARAAQVDASNRSLQDAIDFYTAEHGDRSPAINPDGQVTTSGMLFMRRLLEKTDELGNLDPAGIYGPYLRGAPKNPFNAVATLRIDGADAPSDTVGWRFDSDAGTVKPDDSGSATRVSKFKIAAGIDLGEEAAEALPLD